MPSTLTFPGVYIEEIPSGVRTIVGVATSIAAFIGRALRGPTDEEGPVVINSYGDFERIFGGLWVESTLGYAVRDFYLNGGSQAIIVRLQKGATAADIPLPTGAAAPNDLLPLVAQNGGTWGNNLSVKVTYETQDPGNTKQFNLFIVETDPLTGQAVNTENILNVSVEKTDRRYVALVLNDESSLVRVKRDNNQNWIVPNVRPTAAETKATPTGKDGAALDEGAFTGGGAEANKTGLYALEKADLFNLLCIPPHTRGGNIESGLVSAAGAYCETKRAMLLLDPLAEWTTKDFVIKGKPTANPAIPGIEGIGTVSKNSAVFFPRLRQPNPLLNNQLEDFVPCGAVAGIFARTDAQRGVWKAPAGLDATLVGVPQLAVTLSNPEIGELNPLGINCLRTMPAAGRVVWGSRTLQGNDRLASEWKYVPVRRTALFIEESLYRALQWVVFEPNDEPLWAQIRLNVGAFMNSLFRQGAFQGTTPREAYFVKCDKDTTTQNDIDRGIVNILVGFAPLKPAEFVVIKLQQIAGQIQT